MSTSTFHVNIPELTGRLVKVVTGLKSQTFNVYGEGKDEGDYEIRLRCAHPTQFLTGPEELRSVGSATEAADWLCRERGFRPEGIAVPTARTLHEPSATESWRAEAERVVRGAINQLVDLFVERPYLHRVEHSLHCELYGLLMMTTLLRDPISLGPVSARAVQKEWPESVTRSWKSGRRGNFDLVVLSPADAATGIDETAFLGGFIKPPIAIELGLDYGLEHLVQDDRKLQNSGIEFGYLVHFAREEGQPQGGVREAVDQIIARETTGGPRVAYVRFTPNAVEVRRLGEPICELPRSSVRR